MKQDQDKIIDLCRIPRVYKPETIQQRLERERKRIAEQDQETLRRFDEITEKLYNKTPKKG